MNLGRKPDCECNRQFINKIKERNGLTDEAFVYFRDENLFTGSLVSYVIIEERVKTKAGNERKKNSNVPVVHNYCPFCGKKYLEPDNLNNG